MTDRITLLRGDCRDVMATLDENSIDAVVCDPPYHLTTNKKGGTGDASLNLDSPAGRSRGTTGFMGKIWDGGDVTFQPETWATVFRAVKPGAHLVAVGGTRTYHRMVCAIEDAGFEVRDMLSWITGQGFPKSLSISKAAHESICVCKRTKEIPERDLRYLPETDVSTSINAGKECGEVLFAGLSESRTPPKGAAQPEARNEGIRESGLEGSDERR